MRTLSGFRNSPDKSTGFPRRSQHLPTLILLLCACLASLPLLAGCHDAPRENPFDPQLTPPVELTVALDDTTGTATLTWTPYAGQTGFAEYRVLRNQVERTRVDTLAIIDAIGQTSYTDTSLNQHTSYVYRASAVNAGGYEAVSNPQIALPFALPPVQLRAEFDAPTATARLEWTRYRESGFRAYRLLRRTATLAPQLVFETGDSTVTAFVDSNLLGATEYFYQVTVATDRGEEVAGEEAGGCFHCLVASWPLDIQVGSVPDEVRLTLEPDGRLAALVSGDGRVRTLFFARDGRLVEEQKHLDLRVNLPSSTIFVITYDRTTYARVRNAEGLAFLAMATRVISMILPLGTEGALPLQPFTLSADDFHFPPTLDGPEATVLGEISLVSTDGDIFDNIAVFVEGEQVFAEDFDGFPNDMVTSRDESIQGWTFSGAHRSVDGWLGLGGNNSPGTATRAAPAWQNCRLEADLYPVDNDAHSIWIGGDTYSRFGLRLDFNTQQVLLYWRFNPPPGLGLEPRDESYAVSFDLPPSFIPRLGLEAVDGQVRATVRRPVLWSSRRLPLDGNSVFYGSLAAVDDELLQTVNERAFSIDAEGTMTPRDSFASWVSATGVWPAARGHQVAVCMPETGVIRLGLVPAGRADRWTSYLNREMGPFIDEQVGFLNYPLSVAGAPDGGFYVLDAGNQRLLVFDADRNYITQWGGRGSGAGKFNFGDGNKRLNGLNFVGSIAVDEEGYIYVADVFNRRIQKFAP